MVWPSDYVANLIHDAGGSLQLLKCIRFHKDDITALKNMMQLLVLLLRTDRNVDTLRKAGALESIQALQVSLSLAHCEATVG